MGEAQAALTADPTLVEALLYRAAARLRLGDTQGADEDVSAFLEHQPGHGIAHTIRGDARVGRGELGLGIADYDAALRAKDDVETRLKRADALARYGNPGGSDADLEHVAAQGQLERALSSRIRNRVGRGDLAGALADADRLVAAQPDSAEVRLLRAGLNHQRGDRDAARDDARATVQLAAPGSSAATSAQDLLRRLE